MTANTDSDILVPEVHTLAGGFRLVRIHDNASRVGIFGVCVRVGSADEDAAHYGLAHFVEHTIFKGTSHRDAMDILNHMEVVGGELNAYTTSEATVVYSIFPASYASRAVELISDLVMNSQFPAAELKKEKEVVLDEINSYLDNPAEAIYDCFEDLIFAGCGYGHNILGTPRTVRSFKSADCRAMLSKYYRAGNMVAFYCGSDTGENIQSLTTQCFSGLDSTPAEHGIPAVKMAAPFTKRRYLPVHQAHVVMGTVVPAKTASERYAAAMFANIIGGPGMNSLLNIELRERRGLVYSVEASTTFLAEGSCLITVYFGCDGADRKECVELARRVFADIASGAALTPEKFEQARTQYLGQLTVAVENRENRIIAAARSTLFHGAPITDADVRAGIGNLTPADIAAVASNMLNCSSLYFLPRKQ